MIGTPVGATVRMVIITWTADIGWAATTAITKSVGGATIGKFALGARPDAS